MGGGIAMACVNAGLDVRLKDTSQAALDQGLATIRRNYGFSVSRGRMTQEAADARVASIRTQVDYAGFDQVDLVVEAAFESLDLKRQIFKALGEVVKADCVLGTNTSTLDIDVIAAASSRAPMVVGLHFFSPANVMRLLEIVRGKETSPAVLATAQAFGKRLGKVGVVVGNCPGFVGNRMMFPYMYETKYMVEEGATPQQVDGALREFGMAMGMFAVDDMAGLDVAIRVQGALNHFSAPSERRPLVQAVLVESGRLGQKTGKGWYLYGDDRKPRPDPEVVALIRSKAAAAGISQREFSNNEIVERAIYALINEGARALDLGLALRAGREPAGTRRRPPAARGAGRRPARRGAGGRVHSRDSPGGSRRQGR
jgi:3-hydroxyacyl-CoA dehydrogenase